MDPTNTNQNDNQAPTTDFSTGVDNGTVSQGVEAAPVNPEANTPVSVGVDPNSNVASNNPNVSMPTIDPSLVEQEPAGGSDLGAVPEMPDVMVGATDPITMPNPPKAPDPVEEELKAPMTAAAPVPGSIGSAISVPAEQSSADGGESTGEIGGVAANASVVNAVGDANTMPKVPNVAFNDPAMGQQPQGQVSPQPQPVAATKKKMDKKTLIMLCALAGIVVVALVIVLVMMLNQ